MDPITCSRKDFRQLKRTMPAKEHRILVVLRRRHQARVAAKIARIKRIDDYKLAVDTWNSLRKENARLKAENARLQAQLMGVSVSLDPKEMAGSPEETGSTYNLSPSWDAFVTFHG